jgi:hypothetical protein
MPITGPHLDEWTRSVLQVGLWWRFQRNARSPRPFLAGESQTDYLNAASMKDS